MPCYTPLPTRIGSFNDSTGKMKRILLPRTEENLNLYSLRTPCGSCIGCRLEYSRQWAIRCMHEADCHEDNSFITLTYNDKFLPHYNSLYYRDVQLFMKRLRKRLGIKIRYYGCGEYGSLNKRPHYHLLIFGYDFPDKKLFKVVNKLPLFTSDLLDDLWTHPVTKESYGFASVGTCTFESAAYVARYMLKKVKGNDHKLRYFCVDTETGEAIPIAPEKAIMSRNPGIAADWWNYFGHQVVDKDYVIVNGKKVKPPKFYDTLLAKVDPERLELIKSVRTANAEKIADNSESRLMVRRKVKERDIGNLIRSL